MQIQQMAQITKEHLDSAVSYGVGGAGVLMALNDIAKTGTLLVGLVVIVMRAIYDGIKLYRFIKKGKSVDSGSDKV